MIVVCKGQDLLNRRVFDPYPLAVHMKSSIPGRLDQLF